MAGPDADALRPAARAGDRGDARIRRAAVAPGHFAARYLPPADRFPQVALLVVELGNGAARLHCATRIALEGSTVFPFHTERRRRGDDAGRRPPVRPGGGRRQGHVEIPIDVPPGVRKAAARAVDRNGASRETEVDLQLPAVPARAACWRPPALEVGSFTEIIVAALDENGAPAAPDQLTLARLGRAGAPPRAGRPARRASCSRRPSTSAPARSR